MARRAWKVGKALNIELEKRALEAFRSSGYSSLHAIVCRYHNNSMILRGTVPTQYLKQIAQNLVLNLRGVQKIRNEIEVSSSDFGVETRKMD